MQQLQEMSPAEFKAAVAAQSSRLPPRQEIPNGAQEIARKLGKVLLLAELRRVKGTKQIPLYPVAWEDKKCLGIPLELCRVTAERKTDKAGSTGPNPNRGRFFFARRVPVYNEDGTPKMRSFEGSSGETVEVPDTKLSNFVWLNETDLNTSGALDMITKEQPDLCAMLRSQSVDGHEWHGYDRMMYLLGLSENELVDRFMGAPEPKPPKKKRKRDNEEDNEEEEDGAEESDDE